MDDVIAAKFDSGDLATAILSGALVSVGPSLLMSIVRAIDESEFD
jgi:hypothetical protein